MEKKMKTKHHHKHGKKLHRPLDGYELYELEHKQQNLVKLPSDRPMPRSHEPFRPDYHETGRETQPYWRPPGGGDGEIFRPDYNGMVHPYWRPPASGDDGENIDVEAERFIQWEHEKFELSKWMSMNPK